jgi:TonB family protein
MMEVAKQDPSPQSASTSTGFIESHMAGTPKVVPAGASASQSNAAESDVIGNLKFISSQTAHTGQNGVTMPLCKYCPNPDYSPEARDANIQGTVYLQIVVLSTGRAGEIKVIQGLEESLDKEAIKVVRDEWLFKPATDRNGNPVDASVPVEIAFQLFGPPQPTQTSAAHSTAASPATTPLTSSQSLPARIFTGTVTDNAATAPFYMGLVNVQTIYAPQPELPQLARQANVKGPVTLNIIVNTEGKVIEVNYVKGPAMVVQSAIDTVRNWIIKGTHEGAPVTFQMSVEVSFTDK